MDPFWERLILRAATIDEILSDDFEALPGQKGDSDLAGRRLAAWCRACASGDWSLFDRRLQRDGHSIGDVLAKFATIRRRASSEVPAWVEDAIWILAALESRSDDEEAVSGASHQAESYAFEHLLALVVEQADDMLAAGIDGRAMGNLAPSACANLRCSLLRKLSALCAPVFYERFRKSRDAAVSRTDDGHERDVGQSRYFRFIGEMKAGGFRNLLDEKPVLLRLMAAITRQWIDTCREFVLRLDADRAILGEFLPAGAAGRVATIEDDVSDPHHGGHAVLLLGFEDGSRLVYKPKDLHLDLAWHALVRRLNRNGAPVDLLAMRVIARDGYGWTEFIEHTGSADAAACRRFFRRIGAWLALFHCFAGTDIHQENIIAAGEHPVPIDLEMILQAVAADFKSGDVEAGAVEAAMATIRNSVINVGLLPAYARSSENRIVGMGGTASDWTPRTRLAWHDINTDIMRPTKTTAPGETIPNLPHVNGRYAKLGSHIEDVISGFEDYGTFLRSQRGDGQLGDLFAGFGGLAVRKVIRPTQFYYMLLRRLKDHRAMHDGVVWSAQADFLARLTDWDKERDPLWPLQRAERAALIAMNVPHFISPSDRDEIGDATGITVRTGETPGMERAKARIDGWDEGEIAWQVEVIRQNTTMVLRSAPPTSVDAGPKPNSCPETPDAPSDEVFLEEADKIAAELSRHAIRKGRSAAWIGLDWLGDSEIGQLAPLGADLYNGACGIALFLAAHARMTACESSEELARDALAHLRKSLRSRNAARMARSLGLGGGTGLGSIVYGLAATADLLGDKALLADAHAAAGLFTDDLIAADTKFDVIGGSAGGILGLLRLHRDSGSADALERATQCGDHLLTHGRVGPEGRRSWSGQGSGQRALNGMSHGAAGFAYALASLAAATGRTEFADASAECIAYENSSYDAACENWPDFRAGGEAPWTCQWCHGAPGIGLARIATVRQGMLGNEPILTDVQRALAGAERRWVGRVDTLCCGSLGSVEFFCEAGAAIGRDDLRAMASRRMSRVIQTARAAGDYRWNAGKRRFNLGLFRGLAGVGYTCLRQVDGRLPCVLLWE